MTGLIFYNVRGCIIMMYNTRTWKVIDTVELSLLHLRNIWYKYIIQNMIY